jgi:hypothetical protein
MGLVGHETDMELLSAPVTAFPNLISWAFDYAPPASTGHGPAHPAPPLTQAVSFLAQASGKSPPRSWAKMSRTIELPALGASRKQWISDIVYRAFSGALNAAIKGRRRRPRTPPIHPLLCATGQ